MTTSLLLKFYRHLSRVISLVNLQLISQADPREQEHFRRILSVPGFQNDVSPILRSDGFGADDIV